MQAAVNLSVGPNIPFVALGLGSCVRAGNQTQHCVNGNDRRTAVADQRQGQTDNGHNTDAHAGVDQYLEHQRGACTEAHQTAHVVLKVVETAVDELIAAALGGIHIVQLAENDIECFLQREQLGRLDSGLPDLLDPEIGIHQNQRF